VITNGEMAKILETEAKHFRKSIHAKNFLKVWGDDIIDENMARELAILFLSTCFVVSKSSAEKLKKVKRRLWKDIWNWAPNAAANIQRSKRKNPAYGKTTLDQDALDALLVDYINHTYMPGDLGLLVEHIR